MTELTTPSVMRQYRWQAPMQIPPQEIRMDDEELSDCLIEAVYEAKAQEAAAINNDGLDAQLAYLGITREEAERDWV